MKLLSQRLQVPSPKLICFWRRLALTRFVALDEPSDAFLLPAVGARAILEHLSTSSGLTGSYSLCAWDRTGLKYQPRHPAVGSRSSWFCRKAESQVSCVCEGSACPQVTPTQLLWTLSSVVVCTELGEVVLGEAAVLGLGECPPADAFPCPRGRYFSCFSAVMRDVPKWGRGSAVFCKGYAAKVVFPTQGHVRVVYGQVCFCTCAL